MRYYILRNNAEYVPYEVAVLKQYVDEGRILLHDQAKDPNTGVVNTVGYCLRRNNVKVKIKSKGSFVEQLKAIGTELTLPVGLLKSKQWLSDKRLLLYV